MASTFFEKQDCMITAFVVPWIFGLSNKTPEDAVQKIKWGATLNPLYYPKNQKRIAEEGPAIVEEDYLNILFSPDRINHDLPASITEVVYMPVDCMSGLFNIKINDRMGLGARLTGGVTKGDDRKIVMVDSYLWKFYDDTEEATRKLLQATMAVWKAKKGVCYFQKLNRSIEVDFDEAKWMEILDTVRKWADDTLEDYRK